MRDCWRDSILWYSDMPPNASSFATDLPLVRLLRLFSPLGTLWFGVLPYFVILRIAGDEPGEAGDT